MNHNRTQTTQFQLKAKPIRVTILVCLLLQVKQNQKKLELNGTHHSLSSYLLSKAKAVPLHAKEALGGKEV
jgi:hypothetical protein